MRLLSFKRYGVKYKAATQVTGKLGFSKATSDTLRFESRQYVNFFLDDYERDLYMVILAGFVCGPFIVLASSGYC